MMLFMFAVSEHESMLHKQRWVLSDVIHGFSSRLRAFNPFMFLAFNSLGRKCAVSTPWNVLCRCHRTINDSIEIMWTEQNSQSKHRQNQAAVPLPAGTICCSCYSTHGSADFPVCPGKSHQPQILRRDNLQPVKFVCGQWSAISWKGKKITAWNH